MAKGNSIIVSGEPRGKFLEGKISGTSKPGTWMQIKASDGVDEATGRFTWEPYAPGTNGHRKLVAILLPDSLQGKLATDAYVTGTRCFLYCPVPGEELNVLCDDVAGTGSASDFTTGEELMGVTGTGLFIRASGSEESAPFQVLEDSEDLTADGLVHAIFTGY